MLLDEYGDQIVTKGLKTIYKEEVQYILQDVPRYKVINHGRVDQSGLEAIRSRLSYKIYEVDKWPLFDYEVSELEDYTILHIIRKIK